MKRDGEGERSFFPRRAANVGITNRRPAARQRPAVLKQTASTSPSSFPSLPPSPPSLPLPLCASSSTPPPRPTRRVYARRDGQSRLAGRRERALCA